MNYRPGTPEGLKPKDLIGLPWRIAFALQADGWYLRSDIIWNKPNCQPESVKDRPTRTEKRSGPQGPLRINILHETARLAD
jgi:site-specific DNA-methyltransferase (cytosine-N4-specific)